MENVAAAIVLALTHPTAAGRIYNVGEEPALTEADWIRKVGAVAGWQGEVVPVPEAALPALPDLATEQDLVLDTSRIRRELGFQEVVSLEEALERTIRWERDIRPNHSRAHPTMPRRIVHWWSRGHMSQMSSQRRAPRLTERHVLPVPRQQSAAGDEPASMLFYVPQGWRSGFAPYPETSLVAGVSA